MPFTPNRHCSHCGSAFEPGDTWPKACVGCSNRTWNNPTPVVVLLQRVDDGVLAVMRRQDPGAGMIGLVGGFVDHKEDLYAAARRERKEETGIDITDDPIRILEARTTAHNMLVIFCTSERVLREAEIPPFVPNDEVSELVILREPIEMAFSSHTEMLRRFLEC